MIGHLSDPASLTTMLQSYLEEVALARADLAAVRESLRGSDALGQPFHFPSLVADWGLAHFESESAITRHTIERLREDAASLKTDVPLGVPAPAQARTPTGDEG